MPGCEVKAMYPLAGKLDVGLLSCPDLLPDSWELADELPVAMEELLATTR